MKAPLPALLLAATVACGGGGNGGSSPPPSQPPPGNSPQNVCAAADTAGVEVQGEALARDPRLPAKPSGGLDGSTRWRVLEDLWIHAQAEARGGPDRRASAAPPLDGVDVGAIAVLQDEGDLLVAPNPLDLQNSGLRFTPNGGGGYDVRTVDGSFRTAVGTRLTLSDDDTRRMDVPFAFQFYGRRQTAAFVNSDGNVTFGEGDSASTERNVARLLIGPPRVSPFLSDLDPGGSGTVFVNAAADQYTVTWCGVKEFDSARVTSVQTTILPDGTVEMKFGAISIRDAVVGLSPGATTQFAAVDLSASGPTSGGSAAVGERFAATSQIDTVAVARKFYRTHADNYDQLVVWTDVSVVDNDTFAYETTIANEIRGLGIDIYNTSSSFGSGGRLNSLAIMDSLGKYPNDPTQRFLGEANTLGVVAHEVAHRWLAFVSFRNHRGEISDELLGRGLAHWSFFLDTDASVMEGNDISDLGGGSFRTVGAWSTYSRLDLYAMGLIGESEVPPFFYVESPTNVVAHEGQGVGAGAERHVQRHAPRRAHPGYRCRQRTPSAVHGRRAPGAQPGIRLRGRFRTNRLRRANRQAGSHSPSVGAVLPSGHRWADESDDGSALDRD